MTLADLRPALDPATDAFGVAATVTPKDGTPVSASVIAYPLRPEEPWIGPLADRVFAGGPSGDVRPRFAVRKDQVPTLPAGSTIVIAAGPEAGTWKASHVDSVSDPQLHKVAVR
jgi:hypothetical protein